MSRSRSSGRKAAAVTVLAVAALAVGGATLALHSRDAATPSAVAPTATGSAAATSVPVAQPAAVSSATPSTHSPLPNPADVATDTATASLGMVVTYASVEKATGDVVIGAYVAGLVENGGTCSVVLTKGGAAPHATSQGAASASTTSCGELRIPASSVGPGTWQANLTYSSPAGGQGARAAGSTTVEVP